MLSKNDFSTQKLFNDYQRLCQKSSNVSCSSIKILSGKDFITDQKYREYLASCKNGRPKQESSVKNITPLQENKPGLFAQAPSNILKDCPPLPETMSCTSLWNEIKAMPKDPSTSGNTKTFDKDACSPWNQMNCCNKLKTIVIQGKISPIQLAKQSDVAEADLTAIASYYLSDPATDNATKTQSLNNQLKILKNTNFRSPHGSAKIHLINEKHNVRAFNTLTRFLLEKMHYSRYEVRKVLAQMLQGNTPVAMNFQKNALIDNIAKDSKIFTTVLQTPPVLIQADAAKKKQEISNDSLILNEICK